LREEVGRCFTLYVVFNFYYSFTLGSMHSIHFGRSKRGVAEILMGIFYIITRSLEQYVPLILDTLEC